MHLRAYVDELGDLERELSPHKAKIARADAVRRLLREAHRDLPAVESFSVAGARWILELGAKANETAIDAAKLVSLLGSEGALELASFTLKALDLAAPEIRLACTSTCATGSRPIKLYAAPVPAPAPAAKKAAARAARSK